jgi:hypothetical protein
MVPYTVAEQFLNQSSYLLYGSNVTSCVAVSITIYSDNSINMGVL